MLELVLRLGIALEQLLVAAAETGLQLAHFSLELAQMRGGSVRVLLYRPGGVRQNLLLHETDARSAGDRNVPAVRGFKTGCDSQQGCLSDPIRADEADAIAVGEPERDVAKHEALAETFRDRLYRKDAHGVLGTQRPTRARYPA